LIFECFLAFFGEKFLLHEFYFEHWICFILDWIIPICKFWFSNVFWPFLEKSSCFINIILRIKFASFWTGLYMNLASYGVLTDFIVDSGTYFALPKKLLFFTFRPITDVLRVLPYRLQTLFTYKKSNRQTDRHWYPSRPSGLIKINEYFRWF